MASKVPIECQRSIFNIFTDYISLPGRMDRVHLNFSQLEQLEQMFILDRVTFRLCGKSPFPQ